MRKRRRLADKLIISVCAVLVAVSAFFYAPMDVSAEESVSVSGSVSDSLTGTAYKIHQFPNATLGSINFSTFDSNIDDSSFYRVNCSYDLDITVKNSATMRFVNVVGLFDIGDLSPMFCNVEGAVGTNVSSFSSSGAVSFIADGLSLKNVVPIVRVVGVTASNAAITSRTLGFTLAVSNVTLESVSSEVAGDYQAGYDDGFSDGESSGYGNGYSDGFTDGESSVDTDGIYNDGYSDGHSAGYSDGYNAGFSAGESSSSGSGGSYDEGFQAGKDSVDTQSYYDAGYQAGYDTAYQAGYDIGYEKAYDIAYENGYQSAMDRVNGWGADTSDYPLLVYDNTVINPYFYIEALSNVPQTSYGYKTLFNLDFDVNPHHTYKFVFDVYGFYTNATDCLFSSCDIGFRIGDLRFCDTTQTIGANTVFIEGSSLGSVVVLDGYAYQMRYYSGINESNDFTLGIGRVKIGSNGNVVLKVYDMGPSGDTQNHIANQTDSLTNGFDNSQGNSVNSDLSSGLNEYQTSEDTLWATATTGLKDFTFFDFASVPAMITGMSFITAIMGSWFNQAGGASGVGIVLSILFSVVLVAMVLGLYRWYQSRGGKD